MHWLRSRIDRHPRLALILGKAIFLAGSILIVGAVFARSGLVAVNTERAAAGQPAVRTLAEAYPQYPTWIVPEGPVGYSIAAALVLAGMALTVLAEQAARRGMPRGGAR
ncbi:hypothetical protein [Ramlibacter sp. AN1133]|uniref:hypothetical protein n=1 Tax=Ramlibacter sp. AN1133 TaxID=3133429 RepID=UPI0030C11623